MSRARRAAALVVALATAASAGDIVVMKDGKLFGSTGTADPPSVADFAQSRVTVQDETLEGVVYRDPAIPQRQTIPRADVLRVDHDPATVPSDLARGAALAAERHYAEARERLFAVARNLALPAWAQAEAAYRAAETYSQEGDLAAADRALAAFAKERPHSRYALDAGLLRGRVLEEAGHEDDAKRQYDAVAALPGLTDAESSDASFRALWIDVLAARRSGTKDALVAAETAIDALRARPAATRSLRARCDVARAACEAALGRGDDAWEPLAALVAASQDTFVLAVGNALLGDAARARGEQKKDRAALEEAHERYLRVVLLYASGGEAYDFVAAAWYHAGEPFRDLAAAGPAGAEDRGRARREWEALAKRFPSSEWAKRAKAAAADLQ